MATFPFKRRRETWHVLLLVALFALVSVFDRVHSSGAPLVRTPRSPRRSRAASPHFWLVWTKDAASWTWVFQSVLEALFVSHPMATVTVLSPTLPLEQFDCLSSVGYAVTVERYNIADLARGTPAEALAAPGGPLSMSYYRHVHESDLARILILLTRGGTYIDTDMFFLRPLDDDILAVAGAGYETVTLNGFVHVPGSTRINNAWLHFPQPQHPLLQCMVEHIAASFNSTVWACIGPDLLIQCKVIVDKEAASSTSSAAAAAAAAFVVHDRKAFYPLDWQHAWWVATRDTRFLESMALYWPPGEWLDSYAVHLYTSRMDYGLTAGVGGSGFFTAPGPPKGSILEGLVARHARLTHANCSFRAVIEREEERVFGVEWEASLSTDIIAERLITKAMMHLLRPQPDIKLYEVDDMLFDNLNLQRRVKGDDHPDAILALNNYALIKKAMCMGAGDGVAETEAEVRLRESLERKRRVFGDTARTTLQTAHHLGVHLRNQGHGEEARALLEEARVGLEKLGPAGEVVWDLEHLVERQQPRE